MCFLFFDQKDAKLRIRIENLIYVDFLRRSASMITMRLFLNPGVTNVLLNYRKLGHTLIYCYNGGRSYIILSIDTTK